MTLPDLLRLLSIPVFGWLAVRDYKTRRIPSSVWYPLVTFAVFVTGWELLVTTRGTPIARQLLTLQILISIGILLPLGVGFYWFGGFGKADMKAFVFIALLFPAYPTYQLGNLAFPLHQSPIAIFSLTIITNAMVLGVLYPGVLAIRNALAGHLSIAMFVGHPVDWQTVERTHGKLLETTDGLTFSGLDLDALRMYLRWRGCSLETLRDRPDTLRDPQTIPATTNPPTDGAVIRPGDRGTIRLDGGSSTDPWGADAFLASLDHSAYGTTPNQLRRGLDLLTTRDTVWISPGIPFLVPLGCGLIVALTYGDLLFRVLTVGGFV